MFYFVHPSILPSVCSAVHPVCIVFYSVCPFRRPSCLCYLLLRPSICSAVRPFCCLSCLRYLLLCWSVLSFCRLSFPPSVLFVLCSTSSVHSAVCPVCVIFYFVRPFIRPPVMFVICSTLSVLFVFLFYSVSSVCVFNYFLTRLCILFFVQPVCEFLSNPL